MPKMKDLYQNLESIQKTSVLLDVRTAEEFAAGHIDGSVNISHDLLGPQHLEQLKNAPHLHVYCRRGGRAGYACEVLQSMGIKNFTGYFEDGMEVWMDSGFPVQKS